jgi:hypothetical protein
MTPLGWLFLIVSLSFVWGLMIWSFAKVLSLPPEERAEVAQAAEETTPD